MSTKASGLTPHMDAGSNNSKPLHAMLWNRTIGPGAGIAATRLGTLLRKAPTRMLTINIPVD